MLFYGVMSNRSVYLDDDEEDWVEQNINNFSDFTRQHVREAMAYGEKEKIEIERTKSRSFLFYVSLFMFGFLILVFSILINYLGFGLQITMSIEAFMLIALGMLLELIAIFYLMKHKNGGVNVKKV